jgi:hypothetical protein
LVRVVLLEQLLWQLVKVQPGAIPFFLLLHLLVVEVEEGQEHLIGMEKMVVQEGVLGVLAV